MELEDDLRKLRWAAPPSGLRARILREARAASRSRLIPPWFATMERHWLYPGRVPAAAIVAVWLVIASLYFTTPVSLLPESTSLSHINEDDLARLEIQRAQLMAELRRDLFNDPISEEPPANPPSNLLPSRS